MPRKPLGAYAGVDWADEAKRLLKAHLKRAGCTYKDLADRFEKIGVHETEANIRNKLSRGSFTAAFFLQCLALLGVYTIKFGENNEAIEWYVNSGDTKT